MSSAAASPYCGGSVSTMCQWFSGTQRNRVVGGPENPGSVFGHIITNRKSRRASHTRPLPPFVYRGEVGFELNSQRKSSTNVFGSSVQIFLPLISSLCVSVTLLSRRCFTRFSCSTASFKRDVSLTPLRVYGDAFLKVRA